MRPAVGLHNPLQFRESRTFVIALLLLVALLLTALVVYSAYHDVEANQSVVQARALEYSREAAFGIDAFLSSTNRMLVPLSVFPSIRDQQVDNATATLAAVLKASPEYANIWATGADGWNWANPLPNPGGKPIYVGDRRYFQEAMRTGRLSIESIPDSRQHPTKFAVVMCLPVPGGGRQAQRHRPGGLRAVAGATGARQSSSSPGHRRHGRG